MNKLDISKIKWFPLSLDQYHKVEHTKRQIVLHHTASGGDGKGDINYWQSTKERVATAFVVDRDGTIWQCFSSKYYAPHLGIPASTFRKLGFKDSGTRGDLLHKQSIGIEIDSWGFLTKKGDSFYSWTGQKVDTCDVVTYPDGFKGYKYYEKYSIQQIESVRQLLNYLSDLYGIDTIYKSDMWDLSRNALRGDSGIYAHVSYRESGKTDIHPQPELIDMLKQL